jgi:L-xylulose reductase
MSLNEWKGVSVLVTGAGKGIGAEICAALSNLGASVIALSRSVQDLEQLLEMKHAVRIIQCDLSNPLDISRARDNGELNGIDCLVNNAGIAPLEPFLDVSLEKFQATIDTNVTGVMVLSQIVARDMIKRQYHGRIVNVSSVASKSCIKDHTSYCVSKAALDMLTKMMAFELGKYQIRVNSVNPTVHAF